MKFESDNIKLGKYGEKIARKYLKKKGYKFIRKNFIYQKKEVDLIFLDKKNNILIFAEIKTRHQSKYFTPEDSINKRKIEYYKLCIEGFLKINPKYLNCDIRIDSVGITLNEDDYSINHSENILC